MANEAVCIEKSVMNDVMRTCADAVGLEKGTIVWLVPNAVNTISGSAIATGAKAFGGITTAEKVASDGSTRVSVAMNGVYDLKCVNAGFPVAAGSYCVLSGQNLIAGVLNNDMVLSGAVIGKIEETGAADDTIRVRLVGY